MNERNRGLDSDYVTRREWDLHLHDGRTRDTRVDTHLSQQDRKIDTLEATISKWIGGLGVAVIAVQIITTVILSRQ